MDVLLNGQRVCYAIAEIVKIIPQPDHVGVAALVFATVVALALTHVYLNPPGQARSCLSTRRRGVDPPETRWRMAGIAVGKVTNLSLESNQVLVEARINDDAFVGDQSQVDVRMLTIVGGYYVNLASIGTIPLGTRTIRSHA